MPSAQPAITGAPDNNDSATYTIDQLSAVTSTPSRTIRFYQSQGAMPGPARAGRVALYGPEHVERLELIAILQERGLRLSAIVDLIAHSGAPVSVGDWLGLDERLSRPWTSDPSHEVSAADMEALLGPGSKQALADLVRIGLARPVGGGYRVPSPALLRVVVQLRQAGIDIETAGTAGVVLREGLAGAADRLVAHFMAQVGRGFGERGAPGEVARGLDALRPLGIEAVQVIFAQEIERAISEQVPAARVPVSSLAGTRRRPRSRSRRADTA